jgi:hypothetical protein
VKFRLSAWSSLSLIAALQVTNLQAQTITATNGDLQSTHAVVFTTTGAFFPNEDATSLESNRFALSITTDFVKVAASTIYSASEMYRYQIRLLDSANKAVVLSSGSSLLTTNEFTISLTELRKTSSRPQSFFLQPKSALPISSSAHTVSLLLQRRTLDTTGLPTHVWVDQGAAETLSFAQEIATPQLRISSLNPTEMRLSYTYETALGDAVATRWKLLASSTLEANSFTPVSGHQVTEGQNNEYSYTIPISPTTTPKQFFRLGN